MNRLTVALLLLSTLVSHAQISIATSGTYQQNFNSLVRSGGTDWINNETLPGWLANYYKPAMPGLFPAFEGPVERINASEGTISDFASFGNGSNTDRAIGLYAPTNTYAMGLVFVNNSGNDIIFDEFSYTGEMWRHIGQSDRLGFSYRISSTQITDPAPLDDANWTSVGDLALRAFIFNANVYNTNGNDPANQRLLSANLGITVAPNEYIMFRWKATPSGLPSSALAVDDLSIAYSVVPEPSAAILMASVLAVVALRRMGRH